MHKDFKRDRLVLNGQLIAITDEGEATVLSADTDCGLATVSAVQQVREILGDPMLLPGFTAAAARVRGTTEPDAVGLVQLGKVLSEYDEQWGSSEQGAGGHAKWCSEFLEKYW